MANIYGLFDPRSPDVIMYVGKGGEKRPPRHWRSFLCNGRAVNALLRRWFEGLKIAGVAPAWRFLEEDVTDWQQAERDWITCCRVVNPVLCNVADGGNQWPLEAGKLGGKVVSQLYPEKAKQLGRKYGGISFKHLRSLNPALMCEFASRGGRIGGRRTHELHPDLAREIGKRSGPTSGKIGGRRTHELHPDLAREMGKRNGPRAGRIGCHNRWHVARGTYNSSCTLCSEGLKV